MIHLGQTHIGKELLGNGLVHCDGAAGNTTANIGQIRHFQQALDCAILAMRAM